MQGIWFWILIAMFALMFWAVPEKTQQTQTVKAFDQWAEQCKPNDMHYGQTSDGHGQRAFIVTCTQKGAE